MKILLDNRYNGTLERKIAVAMNSNMVNEEGNRYILLKKDMSEMVEELARVCRNFQNNSNHDENFS